MARHITAGIDIGTSEVKVVIAEEVISGNERVPKIIGVGVSETKGLREGYVVYQLGAARGIRAAIAHAQNIS